MKQDVQGIRRARDMEARIGGGSDSLRKGVKWGIFVQYGMVTPSNKDDHK